MTGGRTADGASRTTGRVRRAQRREHVSWISLPRRRVEPYLPAVRHRDRHPAPARGRGRVRAVRCRPSRPRSWPRRWVDSQPVGQSRCMCGPKSTSRQHRHGHSRNWRAAVVRRATPGGLPTLTAGRCPAPADSAVSVHGRAGRLRPAHAADLPPGWLSTPATWQDRDEMVGSGLLERARDLADRARMSVTVTPRPPEYWLNSTPRQGRSRRTCSRR